MHCCPTDRPTDRPGGLEPDLTVYLSTKWSLAGASDHCFVKFICLSTRKVTPEFCYSTEFGFDTEQRIGQNRTFDILWPLASKRRVCMTEKCAYRFKNCEEAPSRRTGLLPGLGQEEFFFPSVYYAALLATDYFLMSESRVPSRGYSSTKDRVLQTVRKDTTTVQRLLANREVVLASQEWKASSASSGHHLPPKRESNSTPMRHNCKQSEMLASSNRLPPGCLATVGF
ncbi:unnamed protein product [Protopolystoma xenopodis]|uniref:Uncharacterized protein n=1 Tax=Protopolystoma xenopodis TaxID=117903 RepID=A0A448WG22_9PLAT|nr:unnamed protein product [Protopolystoma xenopodis]